MDTSKNPDFSSDQPKGYPTKNKDFSSGQPKGYPTLKLRFPRLAFGRTLNF